MYCTSLFLPLSRFILKNELNRNLIKFQPFTIFVGEVPLIGKMYSFGAVRHNNKSRGPAADLGSVVKLQPFIPVNRR